MHKRRQEEKLIDIVQRYNEIDLYALELPTLKIEPHKLESIALKDVLLLDMKKFKAFLMKDEKIVATLFLVYEAPHYLLRVNKIYHPPLLAKTSTKYQLLRCSLGEYPMDKVTLETSINSTLLKIEDITLKIENTPVAKGILVNVEGRIGVEITSRL